LNFYATLRQEVHRSATWPGPSSQPPGRGTREPGEPGGGGLKTCPPLRKVADLRALRRAAEDSKSASSRIKIQFIEFLCEKRRGRVLA